MRVALAQINPTVGDIKGNQLMVEDYILQASAAKADVVAFPELVICGYPPEDLLYKKHFVQRNLSAIKDIAKKVKDIIAIVGFVDLDSKGHLYNAAALMHKGKIMGIYHKEELPNYGVFDEKRYFTSGTKNKLFKADKTTIGVNICEDIWIPQAVYKKQAKGGAKVLINISSSPYDITKLERREKMLKKRAQETKTYICYVNVVGGQDELVFDGGSLIIDPRGKVIARAQQFEEELLLCDLKESTKVLSPISPLAALYKALVLGTRDYIYKNGFKKVLIGLSGGIDSALVAAIAVDAIGRDNVIGVSMPSRFTSEGTRSDARFLAENLGIEFKEISIEKAFGAYLEILAPEFKNTEPNIAEENLQARIRGNILMALSNKFGWLVLTTGNKSEIGVGYCTLYGDMSGGFAVIKDVPKTKVYELVRLRNKATPIIPESIIDRPPTAELRHNQKDQDSLPPYEILDEILADYVENHRSLNEISKKFDSETVKKTINLIDRNEYKRRQAPPGIKITQRAFGKDWRLPITNKYREF